MNAEKMRVVFTLVFFCLVINCTAIEVKSFIPNGDMDKIDQNERFPENWRYKKYHSPGAKVSLDKPGYQSAACIKIENQLPADSAKVSVVRFESKINIPAGSTLRLSAMSKAEGVVKDKKNGIYGVMVKLIYEDGHPSWLRIDFTPGTHDWEKKEAFLVLKEAVTGFDYCYILLKDCKGTAWFDDVNILVQYAPAASKIPAGAHEVPGNLDWPKTWTVFSPFEWTDGIPSPDILKNVPQKMTLHGKTVDAREIHPRADGSFDFTEIWNEKKMNAVAYAFIKFNSPNDQTVNIGMGADWWLQAWLDGKPLYDTLEAGNELWPPAISNHIVNVPVTRGAHILAVRFISGSGSSILALGGPNELRQLPAGQWKTVKPVSTSLHGKEQVANGNFENGGKGNPWLPDGWLNDSNAPFVRDELLANSRTAISNKTSLEINTLAGKPGKRRIYNRISLIPAQLYRIAYKARHLEGGVLSLSLRESPNSNHTYFLGGGTIAGGEKKYVGYLFCENPRPYLVIETEGSVKALIDDISIKPCFDSSMRYKSWREQRVPRETDIWYRMSDNLMLPASASVISPSRSIKVLSIMPRFYQRSMIELARRVNMKFTAMMFDTREMGSNYWRTGQNGPDYVDMTADCLEKLNSPSDCILLDFINASSISPEVLSAVLQKVNNGTGLVICGFDQPYYPYKDGKNRKDALDKFHQGTWGTALNDANKTTEQTEYVKLGHLANSETEFYKYGRGRIAFLRDATMNGNDRGVFESRLEYRLKALLWASGQVPETRITSMEINNDKALYYSLERKTLPAMLAVSANAVENISKSVFRITDKNCHEVYSEIADCKNRAFPAFFSIPKISAGEYCLTVQLLNAAGQVLDWQTVTLEINSSRKIMKTDIVSGKRPYFIRGETVNGHVLLKQPLGKNEKLQILLKDDKNRIWQKTEAKGNNESCSFSLTTKNLLDFRNFIVVQVSDADGIICEQENDITVVPAREWYNNNFNFIAWAFGYETDYYGLMILKELHKIGVNGVIAGNSEKIIRNALLADIRGIPNAAYTIAWENSVEGNSLTPVRNICLSGDTAKKKVEASIRSISEKVLKYAPLVFFIDHEVDLLGHTNSPADKDICFSKSCIRDFSEFLRKDYQDINTLNAAWNTKFKSWDEVSPIVLSEAVKKGQIARWIDHRRHMDRVWTDFSALRRHELRKYDPDAEVLAQNYRSGPTVNNSFNGIDYWTLMNEVVGCAAMPESYMSSFIPPERQFLKWLPGATWWPFVWTAHDDLLTARLNRQVWKSLLLKMGGYNFYGGILSLSREVTPANGNTQPAIAPDLKTTRLGDILKDAVGKIQNGIYTFVKRSKEYSCGIGLYYSRSSEHACTAWQKIQNNDIADMLTPRGSQFCFFAPVLKNLHRNFTSFSYGQIENGILKEGKFKLLILPFSQAVSPKEAEQIRAFVKAGGYLLADIRPAICDEHGKCAHEGLLDDVFGVRHDPGWENYRPFTGSANITCSNPDLKINVSIPGAVIGQDIQLRNGRSLGKSGKIPLMIMNEYGKGKAILLNFSIPDYTGKNEEGLNLLFQGILNYCGIPHLLDFKVNHEYWFSEGNNRIPVSKALSSAEKQSEVSSSNDAGDLEGAAFQSDDYVVPEIVRYENGAIDIFGIWYNMPRGRGETQLHVGLPREGYVYNLMKYEYCGSRKNIDIDMPLEGICAYAVVPYEIQEPVVSGELDPSLPNPAIVCEAKLLPDQAARENHVLVFKLIGPDREECEDFTVCKTAVAGKAGHKFVLPVNAPGGAWQVKVTEAISGKTGNYTITLSKPTYKTKK